MYEVTLERTFTAMHALRHYRGGTEPLHQHEWRVWITIGGRELDPSGCMLDFVELERWFQEAVAPWRDGNINEVPPFDDDTVSPSAENVARTIYDAIEDRVPGDLRLIRVEVEEEVGCRAAYLGRPLGDRREER